MQTMTSGQMNIDKAPSQYIIYAYQKYASDMIGYNKWQCLAQLHDAQKALEKAQRMFESAKFEKIEIQEKKFDSKNKRYLVSTFRIFERTSKARLFILPMLICVFIAVMGLFVLEML